MITYDDLKNNFFFITGPNVIESEEQIMFMAKQLKAIFEKHKLLFIFNYIYHFFFYIIYISSFVINTSLIINYTIFETIDI